MRVHRIHLQQLFQNLIGNAIKYNEEQPPLVHITAEKRESEWLFSVRDNGIGIDPGYRQHTFAVFRRLHNAAKYSGTAIGLAICKRIIERYHGHIWVESHSGPGSTFRFTLPV